MCHWLFIDGDHREVVPTVCTLAFDGDFDERRPACSVEHGDSRLIEFQSIGGAWTAGRQWRYTISPTPRVPGFPQPCSDGENGLVELLALTDTTLLSMERSFWLDAGGSRFCRCTLFKNNHCRHSSRISTVCRAP